MKPSLRRIKARTGTAGRRFARAVRRETPGRYWTRHNGTRHREYETAAASLARLAWRNGHYIDYDRVMPVDGADGLSILDFGGGPGHDLVGFTTHSKPARLVGYDLSSSSLGQGERRLALHGARVELILGRELDGLSVFPDASFDLIHSSGVIHHASSPAAELAALRRLIRPGGRAQVMVYNYDSLFLHLSVAYAERVQRGLYCDLSIREAFSRFTDGEECPIAEVYRPAEFIAMAATAGWNATFTGAAISVGELTLLPKRWDAIGDQRLEAEHREFLAELVYDERGVTATAARMPASTRAISSRRPENDAR